MGTRRDGREAAAQFLFSRDLNPQSAAGADLEEFWELRPAKPAVRRFAEELAAGVIRRLDEIDARLADAAENYRLERFSAADRNVLRIAAFELLYSDTPPAVAINEAVEISRRLGSAESPRFVNGILDRIRRSPAPNPNPHPTQSD